MTSPAPLAAPDPQLAQQLDALLQHNYATPAVDSSPSPASASGSTPPADATNDHSSTPSSTQPSSPPSTTTVTEPHTSRTAPLSTLPATAHFFPVLHAIASTGRLCGYTWPGVRELLVVRVRVELDEYVRQTGMPPMSPSDPSDSFEPRVAHLLLLLSLFSSAPFTLQRLAELLCEPRQHYTTTSHYLAALCKCVYGITADDDEDGAGEEGAVDDEDEAMELAELEAAGVQVTSAMDYVNKELPIVTTMPSVLSVEPADDHSNNMETNE